MVSQAKALPTESEDEANEGVVIALILTITNTVAFSRCDKFSQASSFAGSAFGSMPGNIAGRLAGNMMGRFFK